MITCFDGINPLNISVVVLPSNAARVGPGVRIPPWRIFQSICYNKKIEKDRLLEAPSVDRRNSTRVDKRRKGWNLLATKMQGTNRTVGRTGGKEPAICDPGSELQLWIGYVGGREKRRAKVSINGIGEKKTETTWLSTQHDGGEYRIMLSPSCRTTLCSIEARTPTVLFVVYTMQPLCSSSSGGCSNKGRAVFFVQQPNEQHPHTKHVIDIRRTNN